MNIVEAIDHADSIIKSHPDCKACGMGIACCGCPAQRTHDTRLAEFKQLMGNAELTDNLINYAKLADEVTKMEYQMSQLQENLNAKATELQAMKQSLTAQFQTVMQRQDMTQSQTTTSVLRTQVRRCKAARTSVFSSADRPTNS